MPRFATGIGSLAAVHQVTVTPEVGGRVTAILFTPGATVNAGDPLVQLNDAPDRGDLANYEAQARFAAVTLQRNPALAQQQFGPQDTVDQNQAQLDQARARDRQDRGAHRAEADPRAVCRPPRRAPDRSRAISEPGHADRHPDRPAACSTSISRCRRQQRAEIALGQKVDVTADAFPGRTFTAKITTIEPQIRADTRTIKVQATLANPDEALLPGMFVNAAVVLPPEPDRVVLPETAVDYTLYGDSVYVIRAGRQGRRRQAGAQGVPHAGQDRARWDDKVAILSGVKPGERVVAAGQIKLQDGAAVIVTGNPPPQPPAHPTPQ